MEIGNGNEAYHHIVCSPICQKFKVTDTLHRNGFKDNFYDIVPILLIPALLAGSLVGICVVEVIFNLYCLCKMGIILFFTMFTNA